MNKLGLETTRNRRVDISTDYSV